MSGSLKKIGLSIVTFPRPLSNAFPKIGVLPDFGLNRTGKAVENAQKSSPFLPDIWKSVPAFPLGGCKK
jgi:hypothetical protein